MREYATADRGIEAKRVWERQRKEAQRRRQQQHSHQRAEEPKTISIEQARSRTKLLQADLLR